MTRLITFILIAIASSTMLNARMHSERTGNWWRLNETVRFKLSADFPSGTELTGVVRNSSGVEVASVKCPLDVARNSGWTWKPSVPGFYSVSFSIDGKKLQDSYQASVTPTKGGTTIRKDFTRDIHDFVVSGTESGEKFAFLGISIGYGIPNTTAIDDHLQCAGLMGMGSLRIHPIFWDRIETAKGRFDWQLTDYLIGKGLEQGFHIIGCPWGTPRWALTSPLEGRNIVMKYNAQKPDNISDWTDFLVALVKRHPAIKEWELWNEPGMPGQSCFWNGTPDEICALLRAGHESIKKLQPDAVIWLSQPYLELYEKMIEKGMADYFDRLGRHGKWTETEKFSAAERKHGVSKPWANVEWHAILVSAGDHPYPSEETLASNMLRDLMNQMRQGGNYAAVHALFNTREMETLEFARQNGNNWTHATGLFRRHPRIEPRLAALVLHNFAASLGNNPRYEQGYIFPGVQCAALMSGDKGRVLFIWQDSGEKAKPVTELLAAIGSDSRLSDWEGRIINSPDQLILRPNHIYIMKNPDMRVVGKWKDNQFQVLRRHLERPELDMSLNASYLPGRLFNDKMEFVASPQWTELSNYVSLVADRERQTGFSARFAVAFSAAGLDLAIEVKDPEHAQPFNDSDIWGGDSVQFAIDTTGEGLQDYRMEFSAALLKDGSPLLWKQKTPKFDGYLLQRHTEQMNPVKYGKLQIRPIPGGLLYNIHVELSELHPLRHSSAQTLRFSLLVNNHDGKQRAGYLEWASGIGKFKAPALYGNLTVAADNARIFSADSLVSAWGSAKITRGNGSVHVNSLAGQGNNAAAASTRKMPVTPGAAYNIRFSARGNVRLIGMLTLSPADGGKGRRHDFLKSTMLTDAWRDFSFNIVIPPDILELSLSLLCWQQDGSFEIRDFSMQSTSKGTTE